MIYVSSSCVKASKISDSIKRLIELGFSNIELSGGTRWYEGYLADIFELKEKYSLNLRCHNYFPPPRESLVLNLSDQNQDNQDAYMRLIAEAIDISIALGAKKYGLHAGFRVTPSSKELGGVFKYKPLLDVDEAEETFLKNISKVCSITDNVDVYVENNVVTKKNLNRFGNENPFLLTNYEEWMTFAKKTSVKLLLDVAHLKVSSNSLRYDFGEQLISLSNQSDYFHISDNCGEKDSNKPLKRDSEMYDLLTGCNFNQDDSFTLEVYDDPDGLIDSYETLEYLLKPLQ